ncbi:glycoside hydrolase family 3 C-terminal domain-containing protein [Mangrovicoccus ximenensis]|uniref:glycoside hydrolase family 3 C-terminal domain-containing protein n=1 Tax=Mangrovicoccus ximenensis TaxID=1911570 RepID=UPI000D36929E|nr:glycoside hydrolase family 3 C-terminal domain-containing protein [Mangrovicoccus ximenensis]
MSRQPRRHFAAAFKEQAVARLSEPGVAQAGVARELGVIPSQLLGWRLELAAAGSAEAIRRQQAEAAELAELRRAAGGGTVNAKPAVIAAHAGEHAMIARPLAPAGRALARKAAAGSCVLLKNTHLLPLKAGQKVALIGPLGADRANMLGTWSVSGDARDVTSLEEALKAHDWASLKTAIGANLVSEPWMVDRLNVHGVTVSPDPRSEAELIREAKEIAEAADVVILALGEAKEHAGESSSRLCPDLPEPQRRLVAELAAGCTPVVAVIFAGRPLALGKVPEQVDALLYAWHGGIAGPEGVADILTGAAEPTGRLAVTLPMHPGETPLSYAAEPTGRPFAGQFRKFLTGWLDLEDSAVPAAFPFGFGLTYGHVEYSAPMADVPGGGEDGMAEISVDITNTSERAVTETVQMYISDPEAQITRPGRLLKDFRRVPVAPGETKRVTFEITADMLSYHVAPSLREARRVWDPGRIIVHVGPDSRATKSAEITWGA